MSARSCVQNIVQPKSIVSAYYTNKIQFQTVMGLHFKRSFYFLGLLMLIKILAVAGLVNGKTHLEDDFFSH